jgi:hypothetical protein
MAICFGVNIEFLYFTNHENKHGISIFFYFAINFSIKIGDFLFRPDNTIKNVPNY